MAIEFDEYGYIFSPVVCKGNGGALNHSFGKFFSNGVVATRFFYDNEYSFPTDLKVTAGLNAVTVAPGMIIVNGRYGILENTVTLPIDPADSEARMDHIIARATDSVGGKTVMELDVIKGIPGDILWYAPVVNDGVTSEYVIARVMIVSGENIVVMLSNNPLSLKEKVGGTSRTSLSQFAQYEDFGELAWMSIFSATKTCAFIKDETDNLYKTEIELQNFPLNAVVFKIMPKEANYAAFTAAGVRCGAQIDGKLTLYATTDPGEIEVTIDWFGYSI